MKRAIFGCATGTLMGRGSSQAGGRKATSVRRYDHRTLSVAIRLGGSRRRTLQSLQH